MSRDQVNFRRYLSGKNFNIHTSSKMISDSALQIYEKIMLLYGLRCNCIGQNFAGAKIELINRVTHGHTTGR